jgi:hypothetical protein
MFGKMDRWKCGNNKGTILLLQLAGILGIRSS